MIWIVRDLPDGFHPIRQVELPGGEACLIEYSPHARMGPAVRALRLLWGMTMADLSRSTGLTVVQVSALERQKADLPTDQWRRLVHLISDTRERKT